MTRLTLLIVLICGLWIPAGHAEILGKVRVIDGDTLEVGGHRVALFGIDAPDEAQTCTANGKTWSCGREAAFALAFETAEHWVRCAETGQDADGTTVALCKVGPYDLGALMVRKGWALADRRQSTRYVADEETARAAKAGLWRGEFMPPGDWRALHGSRPR